MSEREKDIVAAAVMILFVVGCFAVIILAIVFSQ